jgi:hypothetical protein
VLKDIFCAIRATYCIFRYWKIPPWVGDILHMSCRAKIFKEEETRENFESKRKKEERYMENRK